MRSDAKRQRSQTEKQTLQGVPQNWDKLYVTVKRYKIERNVTDRYHTGSVRITRTDEIVFLFLAR